MTEKIDFKKVFKIQKGTKRVLTAMLIISIIGISIAYFYYDYQNKSEDPRVKEAKILYKKYTEFVEQNDFKAVLNILDSIELIYSKYPSYNNSYEMGTVLNNRGSVYLTKALYLNDNELHIKDSLLNLAKNEFEKSINIYINWLNEYEKISENEIIEKATTDFENCKTINKDEIEKFVKKRTSEIKTAQFETPRRLSVSYTNLGIVMRHFEKYDSAITCYTEALKLWQDNLSAKNNVNILLGRPLEDRTIIDKIFPKDSEIEDKN